MYISSPFLLAAHLRESRLILDSFGDGSVENLDTRPSHTKPYIYAVLMFIFTLCKAEADVQHLWYGRRAATRIRSELMAAIYDKALKRKDLAGVVQHQSPSSDGDESGKKSQPEGDKGKYSFI